jgi:putative hydrolase of the HAD superfamily
MRFEQVFVDATDTLLRVRGSVGRLYAPVARRHGFEIEPAAVDAAFRPALLASPPPCFPGADPASLDRLEREWWHDLVRRVFAAIGAGTESPCVDRFDAFFAEAFDLFRTTAAWDLLPGAREALVQLHAEGRRLGILSDMDGRLLDVLEHLGIREMFDPIVLSMRAGCSKRDGALFPYALARTPVPAAQCLHIGDSLEWDVDGARRAGMAVIHFDARQHGGAPPGVPAARHWSDVDRCIRSLEATW